MGLLDSVMGSLGGAGGGAGGGGGALAQLLPVVMNLVQQNGGLEGLLQKFQQGGLGDIAQSWVGTGQNLPISPDQLGRALGPELQQAGAGSDLLGPLSQMLPQLVDSLTPQGQLPAGGVDLGDLGKLLGGAGGGGDLGSMLGGLLGKR